MKPIRASRIQLLGLVVALALVPSTVAAEGGCLEAIRGAFEVASEPVVKLQKAVSKAIDDRIHRNGRVQATKVQKILADEWEKSQKDKPADPEKAWNEHVKKWEDEVIGEMTEKSPYRYPSVEELLALMAAKSPTFGAKMLQFLVDKGTIRFKVLAQLLERVQAEPGQPGGKVTYGQALFDLWETRIKLPARKTWTQDDFALFMTEISKTMFRAMHPEPGFRLTWIKAFTSAIARQKTLKIWEVFAKKFTEDYRAKYKSFLEGVTLESYGEPRPDVMRDFYRFGPWDTIYRRLAAVKVLVSGKNSAKVIEEFGLSQEDADAIHKGPIYDKLPRNLKNAIIIAKNPELYQDVIFNAEVEQLSLELMFFTRPIISGLFLYWTMTDVAEAYQENEKRKEFEKAVKANPEKYVYTASAQAQDDRVKNFDDQINQLTIERRALQKELADNPSMSSGEAAMRQKAIDRMSRKIDNLQQLKIDVQRGYQGSAPGAHN